MKVKFDVAALRAAAEREGDLAIVGRRWLRDVLLVITGEAEIEVIQPGQAPTPMLPA